MTQIDLYQMNCSRTTDSVNVQPVWLYYSVRSFFHLWTIKRFYVKSAATKYYLRVHFQEITFHAKFTFDYA